MKAVEKISVSELIVIAQANYGDLVKAGNDYPNDEFIEFDSMINIRPSQGNRSRGVENTSIQLIIREIVAEHVDA